MTNYDDDDRPRLPAVWPIIALLVALFLALLWAAMSAGRPQ
jgi:hypothetical protein